MIDIRLITATDCSRDACLPCADLAGIYQWNNIQGIVTVDRFSLTKVFQSAMQNFALAVLFGPPVLMLSYVAGSLAQ